MILTARAIQRILYHAYLAGEDIADAEKAYTTKHDTPDDLIEVHPTHARQLQAWEKQHCQSSRLANDPSSTAHHKIMIASTPHYRGRTGKRRSGHISIDGGFVDSMPSPSHFQKKPSRYAEAATQSCRRSIVTSALSNLPSALQLLCAPFKSLFVTDGYRMYKRTHGQVDRYPEPYTEHDMHTLLALPRMLADIMKDCSERSDVPATADELLRILETLPTIQHDNIGMFLESLILTLSKSLGCDSSPFNPARYNQCSAEDTKQHAIFYQEHASSPVSSIFAGLYRRETHCTGCSADTTTYQSAVVLSIGKQGEDTDVQSYFEHSATTHHQCSPEARITVTFSSMTVPRYLILAFDNPNSVTYPVKSLGVPLSAGEPQLYNLAGIITAAESMPPSAQDAWFPCGKHWFRQDHSGRLTIEGVMVSINDPTINND